MLDGRIYEQVKDYLVSLCQTELDTYQAANNIFNQLLSSSNGVRLHNLPVPQNNRRAAVELNPSVSQLLIN